VVIVRRNRVATSIILRRVKFWHLQLAETQFVFLGFLSSLINALSTRPRTKDLLASGVASPRPLDQGLCPGLDPAGDPSPEPHYTLTLRARHTLHSSARPPSFQSCFWAAVCKTVRPMLSDRCPVYPGCDVGILWPNGWMNQNET